jgi:hypothetical protein
MRDLYADFEFTWDEESDTHEDFRAALDDFWATKPMSNEEIADACEIAASVLEGHWVRGAWFTYHDGDGVQHDTALYCVEGGLAAALGLDASDVEGSSFERMKLITCPVHDAVRETLRLRRAGEVGDTAFGLDPDSVTHWNDQPERTEQEVLDILHATAKRVLGVEE